MKLRDELLAEHGSKSNTETEGKGKEQAQEQDSPDIHKHNNEVN